MLDINFPQWDKDLFVYLNSIHHPWLDPIMAFLSSYVSWAIVCFGVIILMIYKNKNRGVTASLFMLLGLGINSLTNNLIKLVIMRPRPGSEIPLQEIIRQLEDVGSSYSFFSAHSSNSICLALFVALYFRNKYYSIVAFAWAVIVAYSRIYVGKHYPLDIMVGIMFGIFTGYLSYWIYRRYCQKKGLSPYSHLREKE